MIPPLPTDVRVGEDVADLHEDIRECDKVLGRMEVGPLGDVVSL